MIEFEGADRKDVAWTANCNRLFHTAGVINATASFRAHPNTRPLIMMSNVRVANLGRGKTMAKKISNDCDSAKDRLSR